MRLKWYSLFFLLEISIACATTVDVGFPGPVVVKGAKAIFLGKIDEVFVQPREFETDCHKSLLKIIVKYSYKGAFAPDQVLYIAADNQELRAGKRYVFIANGMSESYSDRCFLGDMPSLGTVSFYLASRFQSTYEIVERTLPNGTRQTLFLIPQCDRNFERLFASDQSVLFDFNESKINPKCSTKASYLNLLENKVEEFQKMRAPWEGPAH